jgi:protein-L-isoaspartate(D-aspartate) O-methyltransferase
MMELLEPKIGERILDIGAGSGWQTALLADIVDDKGSSALPRVVGIERIHELAEMAKKNINSYKLIKSGAVEIVEADGTKGYEQYAPYDKIVAAAAGEEIPEAWKTQLKIGGKIVAPVEQSIVMLEKTSKDDFIKKEYHGFSFVPLVSE